MESNFIKERTVVREQIIKKNLAEASRDKKKHNASTSGAASTPRQPIDEDRLLIFEETVNEKLKQDLADVSLQIDSVCQTIADYLKVKSALKIICKKPKDVRVQTNIGCNFYAQCLVEDASNIYVCVGKDLYLYMNSREALEMIEFKEKQWTQELDKLQAKASKIKAYIKLALEALGMLYESKDVDNR